MGAGRVAVRMVNVHKRFGKVEALRGVDLSVESGIVYGLIGPNGAGKTTTLRIISTIVKHDGGLVEVLGYRLPEERERVKPLIAYLPEDAGLYLRLTGWENLLYFAMLYTGEKRKAYEMADYGAKLSGLSERDLHRKVSEYSKGMIRRVAVARALMTGAKLIILDEPTSGLDVFSAVEIRNIIREFVKENRVTVILSSHNMLEVNHLCDRVALISKGKIIAEGHPKELVEVTGARDLEEAFTILAGGE